MRTRLHYSVQREEHWDDDHNRMRSKITSRGFSFTVTGTKSEEEHTQIVMSFEAFMKENGFQFHGFGDDSWENDQSLCHHLMNEITDIDDKEKIMELYRDWKKEIK